MKIESGNREWRRSCGSSKRHQCVRPGERKEEGFTLVLVWSQFVGIRRSAIATKVGAGDPARDPARDQLKRPGQACALAVTVDE